MATRDERSLVQDHVDTEAAIVVGLGPHGPLFEGTLDLVVAMAIGLGLGVEVRHVVPTLRADPYSSWETSGFRARMLVEGRHLLDQETERVRRRLDGAQPVEGTLVEDAVVRALVAAGRRAELLVLERRPHRGWAGRAGSVTESVAARAHAPVVSVPAAWRASATTLPLVVAVEDAARAPAEVWTAAAIAEATQRPMEILRVDPLPSVYQDVLRREGRDQEFLDQVRDDLVRDVDLPLSVREHVPCSFTARWGRPADVLVDVSSAASMLVLARRDPLLPVGSHLGPVVRQVLRGAACPVLVVEPARAGRSVSAAA